jgi:hypothetical protein
MRVRAERGVTTERVFPWESVGLWSTDVAKADSACLIDARGKFRTLSSILSRRERK